MTLIHYNLTEDLKMTLPGKHSFPYAVRDSADYSIAAKFNTRADAEAYAKDQNSGLSDPGEPGFYVVGFYVVARKRKEAKPA